MKKYNIMITSTGGDLSPFLINYLKTQSIHKNLNIVATDFRENALGKYFADHFETVPHGNSNKYIIKIIYLIKKYKINLIIPTSDEEALNLTKNRKKIETNGTILACTNYENLKVFSSKAKTYEKVSEIGFNVAEWFEVKDRIKFFKIFDYFIKKKKNFVIKPSSARGGRNVIVFKKNKFLKLTKNDKKKFLNKIINEYKNYYPLIISEQLFEPIYDLDLLSWKGKLIRGVVRRRVNPADPNAGHIIEENKEIIKQGEKIVKFFNLSWLYDCDFMFDKKGNPILIEINPRMSGSASVSMAAGVPFFDDIISLARNKSLPKKKIPIGTKIIAFKSLKKLKKI